MSLYRVLPLAKVVVITALIFGSASRAHSTSITVVNTGSVPINFVNLNFDIAPFPAVCSDLDFQLFSTSDSRDSGLFSVPFDTHPLLPGHRRRSFRIPALTGVDFNYIGGSLGSTAPFRISESIGCAPTHVSLHPPTTIDLSAADFPLSAEFIFRAGGRAAPLEPTPEPATLLLLGTTMAGLWLDRWRRRRQSEMGYRHGSRL
jgi:hypothetical protein